jgi:protein transport protein SEC31
MKFDKKCLTAFSSRNPYVAMGTKTKLFDQSFSLTSELFLYNYNEDKQYGALQTDDKLHRLLWCESESTSLLATGNDNGKVTLYNCNEDKSFELVATCDALEGNVLGLDYNPSKNVLAAGSSNGKIIFWNLNKIDCQYTSDIPLTANITALAWNRKVAKILCAGTDKGKILILDIRDKKVAMTVSDENMSYISDVMWHPAIGTSIFAITNQPSLQCFNLSTDSSVEIGRHSSGLIGLSQVDVSHVAASSQDKIDFIDISTNTVSRSIEVQGIAAVSFSTKDPLMALSYTSGTTEVVSTVSESLKSRAPHAIIEDRIVSIETYKIEDKEPGAECTDPLLAKMKGLLYRDGCFELKREELGELLLNEELGEKSVPEGEGFKFDLKDPLILALIRNESDKIAAEGLLENKAVPMPLFMALLDEDDGIMDLAHDCYSQLMCARRRKSYTRIVKETVPSQWRVVLSILCHSSLDDPAFISSALELAQRLVDKERLVIYAMTNNLDEYFKLKESFYEAPKDVYGVRGFFNAYRGLADDLESMGGSYESPMLSEYYWYALSHGRKLSSIKFSDANIAMNRAERGRGHASPKIEPLSRGRAEVTAAPVATRGAGSCYSNPKLQAPTPTMPFEGTQPQARAIPRSPPAVEPKACPSAAGFRIPTSSALQAHSYGTFASPVVKPSAVVPGGAARSVGIPTTPKLSPLGSMSSPGPGMYAAQPGPMPSRPGVYGAAPKPSPIPKPPTYGSIPQPTASPRLPTHGAVPQPSTYASKPAMSPAAPVPQQAAPATKQAQIKALDLDPNKTLDDFEAIVADLVDKASSKASLIIKNKLKEVNKRISVYSSIERSTFAPVILTGITQINSEIRESSDPAEMKRKVHDIITICVDSGQNRADMWLPSIFTLLQLVYQ